MRRVLIVSPTFPPLDGADMHRVRTSLPFFRDHGYEPLVLALDPATTFGKRDTRLCATVPDDVRVWRVAVPSDWLSRLVGLRSPALRSLPAIARVGDRVIVEESVALVYFSTTAFPLMTLGRYWLARHGVPYLLDLQDPWVNDYYARTRAEPPGGRLKYGVAHSLARVLEPVTLHRASHVISVSPAYPEALLSRYAWMRPEQFTVLPFGAPERDFDALTSLDVSQRVFDPGDGCEHWVYAGRGGDDMRRAVSALFGALRRARAEQPARFEHVRLHFVGTSYADAGRAQKTIEPAAREHGVADLVDEQPERVPYFEALRCLRDAHALLVVGSDDAAYTASKLYPNILARRPLLAVLHERSSAGDVLRRARAGTLVTFGPETPDGMLAEQVYQAWFTRPLPPVQTDWAAFTPYTAREMTRRQCAVFDRVLDPSPTA